MGRRKFQRLKEIICLLSMLYDAVNYLTFCENGKDFVLKRLDLLGAE
jgi:hypothetical protein